MLGNFAQPVTWQLSRVFAVVYICRVRGPIALMQRTDDNDTEARMELALLAHTSDRHTRTVLRRVKHPRCCVAFVCYDLAAFVHILRDETCVWDADDVVNAVQATDPVCIESLAFKMCALDACFKPSRFHGRECLFSVLLLSTTTDVYLQRAIACGVQLWLGDLLRWRSATAETVFHRLAAAPCALTYLHLFRELRAHIVVAGPDCAGQLPLHVARTRTDLDAPDHAALCLFFACSLPSTLL